MQNFYHKLNPTKKSRSPYFSFLARLTGKSRQDVVLLESPQAWSNWG